MWLTRARYLLNSGNRTLHNAPRGPTSPMMAPHGHRKPQLSLVDAIQRRRDARGKRTTGRAPGHQPERGRSRQRRPQGMLPCTLTYRPAVLFFITARAFTASLGTGGGHRRFLLLVGYTPQRIRPWAVPRITCRHCRARTGPAGRTSPGEKQIKRPASDYASPFARRPGIGQLAARAPARQQARRPSLTRIAPPVAGSCSACTGTAGRAGTRGISHGPQVRTGHTSRSSPPLSAR